MKSVSQEIYDRLTLRARLAIHPEPWWEAYDDLAVVIFQNSGRSMLVDEIRIQTITP